MVQHGNNTLIIHDNIETIPSYVIDALSCGDCAVISKNGEKVGYTVQFKDSSNLRFVTANTDTIEVVAYKKGANGWAFDKKTVLSLELVANLDKAVFTS